MDNDVASQAAAAGEYLKERLVDLKSRHSCITEVRGMGLLLGLVFNDEVSAKVVAACNEEGLLLNAVRPGTIRFMPPLTVSREEIDQAVERLESALETVMG